MTFTDILGLHQTSSLFRELVHWIEDNLMWILFIVFLVIATWVLETSRLVLGKAPEVKKEEKMGTLDLILILLFGSSIIYSLIVYPLSWAGMPSDANEYLPSIIVFSVLSAMTVFEWVEVKDNRYVSTGLEWIPLSVPAYPKGFLWVFLSFPLLLILGRFKGTRDPLRKVAPVVSALWLGLGFMEGAFPPESLLWLGPLFALYSWVTWAPFGKNK